jgi:hypothetical protein
MTMPNFLVIGAAKSGTSALYYALKQHPQIYMSPSKEPAFFAYEGARPRFIGPGDQKAFAAAVTNIEDYLLLFEPATDQIAIGEASTIYLSLSSISAARIQHHVPNAKLIAVLRQPADRAYSNYQMMVQQGRERESFLQALALEEERSLNNWGSGWRYRKWGFYHALLRPYFERFPREQIRIYLYEDWNSRPQDVLQDIFRFLQVDDLFAPDATRRRNVTHRFRSPALATFMTNPNLLKRVFKSILPVTFNRTIAATVRSMNTASPQPIDPEIRRRLTSDYREDILKLQNVLGRDLAHWLT